MSFACMCPESMPEFDKVWSKHHSEIKDQHKYFVPAEKVYGIKVDDVKVYDRTYKAFLYYDSMWKRWGCQLCFWKNSALSL